MKRTLPIATGVCALLVTTLSAFTMAQDAVDYSGCITRGHQVVKIAEGDAPSDPCSTRESVVHWSTRPSAAETVVDTDLIPGVSLLTEEIEPGVLLVVSDGVEDPALPSGAGFGNRIVAGHDGSVWTFSPWDFRRLGDETRHEWVEGTGLRGDIEVGLGGTIWWTSQHGPGHLLAYDGEEWTVSKRAPEHGKVRELEMDDTGTLWAGWKNNATRVTSVGYLDDSGSWRRVGAWPQPDGVFRGPRLSATGDGEVWLLIEHPIGGDIWHLVDADSKEWEPLQQPKGDIVRLHATPAGTVWARNRERRIVHFDGDDWFVFGKSHGVPLIDAGWKNRHAAPDGSFWLPVFDPDTGRCDGVANFDGTDWSGYLRGYCISSLDVSPDGTVWLRAREPDFPLETFAIRPTEA